MFLITTLCFNAARKGVSCGPSLRTLLDANGIDLVAMSEADIPVASRVAFALEWKLAGWHVAISAPSGGICRVTLCSRFPLKQVSLCEADGQGRCAAALLDFQGAQGFDTLLVVALYLQSGDPVVAQAQANDIISSAEASGHASLMLGDWNLEQSEGDVALCIQNGVVHACDEAARGCELPCTGPRFQGGTRRRRIDYAVSIGDVFASAVSHIPEEEMGSLSDHLAVSYAFDLEAPSILHGPRRRLRPIEEDSAAPELLLPSFFRASFDALLQAGDLDAAWHFLSDQAEDLLFLPEHRIKITARSQSWCPATRHMRTDKEAHLDQSPGLRALRRLLAKLQL